MKELFFLRIKGAEQKQPGMRETPQVLKSEVFSVFAEGRRRILPGRTGCDIYMEDWGGSEESEWSCFPLWGAFMWTGS